MELQPNRHPIADPRRDPIPGPIRHSGSSFVRRSVFFETLGLLVLMMSSVVLPLAADDGILLRFQPEADGRYNFEMTQVQEMTMDLGPLGSQVVNTESRFDGSLSVTSLSDDEVEMEYLYTRFRMKMDAAGTETIVDSASDEESAEGEAFRALLERPIAVTFDRRGRALAISGVAEMMDEIMNSVDEGGEADPELEALKATVGQAFSDEALLAMMQQAQPIYSDRAMKIGDSWNSSFEATNAALGRMAIRSEYELAEVVEVLGRRQARLVLEFDLELDDSMPMVEQLNQIFAAQGGTLDVDFGESSFGGSLWIDLATGLPVKTELDQQMTIDMSVTLEEKAMELKMQLDSDVTMIIEGF